MTAYRENDVVRLSRSVTADVIGEKQSFDIPSGSIGTIIMVHGNPTQPSAYEVEFYISADNCYAIATIKSEDI